MLRATELGDVVVSGPVHDEIIEKRILYDVLTIARVTGAGHAVYYMLSHASFAYRRPPGTDGVYSLYMEASVCI